ncbi:hypothetical protein BA6E_102131 [Bacteroidales bacterium 6E]|nr:hypothetical protein BA6E_102131 [Bacteroidales bacterium 6E]
MTMQQLLFECLAFKSQRFEFLIKVADYMIRLPNFLPEMPKNSSEMKILPAEDG